MLDVEGRHPAVQEYGDRFEVAHLPEGLPRRVMTAYRELAVRLLVLLPDGPLLTNALHQAWQSKNEAVMLAVRVQQGKAVRSDG